MQSVKCQCNEKKRKKLHSIQTTKLFRYVNAKHKREIKSTKMTAHILTFRSNVNDSLFCCTSFIHTKSRSLTKTQEVEKQKKKKMNRKNETNWKKSNTEEREIKYKNILLNTYSSLARWRFNSFFISVWRKNFTLSVFQFGNHWKRKRK